MTSVTYAVPAVAASRDGREAASSDGRGDHACCGFRFDCDGHVVATATSIACEQVIVHTEHTLGLLPRCVFMQSSCLSPFFDWL